MSQITLRTIYDLLGEKFIIPFYQRGYRWTKSQVEQLLDDIWEFAQKEGKKREEFYCLQPVVVRECDEKTKTSNDLNGTWYEVIDGQQRLTTIYIILSYLEKEHLRRTLREAYKKDKFSLVYETREKSADFLKNQLSNGINEENIDFFHMSKSYETVKSWFKNKNYNECDDFLKVLLAKKEKNPVMVVWYEIGEKHTDPVEIFTRLNIGKIPLTNAELIKALFLNSSNFPDSDQEQIRLKQLQIAAEWDEIEYTLQKDEFWFFIFDKNNKNFSDRNYDTRIEYIFDLIKNRPRDAEGYFTFYKFYEDLKSKDIESLWKEIKRFFYTLREWYEDNEFYHLIGYFIATGKDITSIKNEYDGKEKSKFRIYLNDEIYKTINNGALNRYDTLEKIKKLEEKIRQLEYDDKDNVKKVLLLFNILILLNNKGVNVRFPFDRYKKERWDIEHVFSQTDIELKGKALKEYVKLILEFWTGEKIEKEQLEENTMRKLEQKLNKSGNLMKIYNEDKNSKEEFDKIKGLCRDLVKIYNEDKNSKEQFDKIKGKLIEAFQEEKIENRDNISNLVLLDAGTNRAYKNAFFPIKRGIIFFEKIKKGSFVPIGTQNVFLKAYSKRFDNIMFWTEDDAEDYLNAIIETFKAFFNQRGDENEQ